MFTEFHFHDVAFGVFPMVGWMVSDAYKYWAKNSVGDIVDMLMQALEVRQNKSPRRDVSLMVAMLGPRIHSRLKGCSSGIRFRGFSTTLGLR
jgi:hypothetical protein